MRDAAELCFELALNILVLRPWLVPPPTCEYVYVCVCMWVYVCECGCEYVCARGLFQRVIKSDVLLQWGKSLHRLSWLEVAVCRRAICRCPWWVAELWAAPRGKRLAQVSWERHVLLGENLKDGKIFQAACEAGPALWPPWLSGRQMCSPGTLPLEWESITPMNPLPCPWWEATFAPDICLLVPAPACHIQRALELRIQFIVKGNSEVFTSEIPWFCHIPGSAGVLAIISA